MARNWDRVWNDRRILIDGDWDNFLSVHLHYNLGSYNVRRGYYLSVTPVRRVSKHGLDMLEMCPSDGVRFFVKEVNRRSAKADADASRMAFDVLDKVVDAVCKKNGISPDRLGAMSMD